MAKYLGGSDVGFEIPGLGFSRQEYHAGQETGIGNWSTEQIATALTTESGRMAACWRQSCPTTRSPI